MMDKTRKARISGSGIVSIKKGDARISVPHGLYELVIHSNGDYELSASGKRYLIDASDIPQYEQNGTLKVEGDA
jgi:hypothetical protein